MDIAAGKGCWRAFAGALKGVTEPVSRFFPVGEDGGQESDQIKNGAPVGLLIGASDKDGEGGLFQVVGGAEELEVGARIGARTDIVIESVNGCALFKSETEELEGYLNFFARESDAGLGGE